ncbi:MAG: hypothetical protein A2W27_04615 [Deltaproteobacteria bacterium RBG_16_44_11]|nr:MAG: hypothetical protein A2W27_04615 [Deltaproteobacteria bacterium RBG_16_44_11]
MVFRTIFLFIRMFNNYHKFKQIDIALSSFDILNLPQQFNFCNCYLQLAVVIFYILFIIESKTG